jgi:hypothetical protein
MVLPLKRRPSKSSRPIPDRQKLAPSANPRPARTSPSTFLFLHLHLSNSLPLYSRRLQSGHLEIFGSEMLLNRASTVSQLSVVFKVRETNNGALQVAGASDCFVSDGGYLWEGRGMSKRFFSLPQKISTGPIWHSRRPANHPTGFLARRSAPCPHPRCSRRIHRVPGLRSELQSCQAGARRREKKCLRG